jgi:DNA-binding winged helix-turn-helix (wHTH) protein
LRLEFGEFVLDPGTRQLRRAGEERHLGPKAFELLELLLERRPNVVSKEAIRDRLWPGTFVTGSTLATVVGEVRDALADDAKEPRFLRTVHGVGYAFCGEAREAAVRSPSERRPHGLSYRLIYDDREISLRPGENLLGRVDDSVVWIDSPSVSRRHARITVDEGGATLEDLGSRNGTFLRGERLAGHAVLADGDEFRLGQVVIRLRIRPLDATTRTGRAR